MDSNMVSIFSVWYRQMTAISNPRGMTIDTVLLKRTTRVFSKLPPRFQTCCDSLRQTQKQ
eukprot:15351776-Ditylum_brightwellii.AAC.1